VTIVQSNSGRFCLCDLEWAAAGALLRRDHFGVKPFYYYFSGGIFVFATEIKASLPAWVPRWLNSKVADYLTAVVDDPAITFYQDILRLPPAHTATVSRRDTVTIYWSLDPSVSCG